MAFDEWLSEAEGSFEGEAVRESYTGNRGEGVAMTGEFILILFYGIAPLTATIITYIVVAKSYGEGDQG